jgi:hypothetical protein
MTAKSPNHPISQNTPMSTPPKPATTGHMSADVRADTSKLTPELRAGLLKAADAK